jgi:hypothetical protein
MLALALGGRPAGDRRHDDQHGERGHTEIAHSRSNARRPVLSVHLPFPLRSGPNSTLRLRRNLLSDDVAGWVNVKTPKALETAPSAGADSGCRVSSTGFPARNQCATYNGSNGVEQQIVDRRRSSGDEEQLRALNSAGCQQAEERGLANPETTQAERGAKGHEEQDVGSGLQQQRRVTSEQSLADVAERPEPNFAAMLLRRQGQGGDRGH